MKDYPLRFSRPLKQFDGEDVYFVFDPKNAKTVYGEVKVHEGEVSLTCSTDEDIRVGDLVEIPSIEGAEI